MGAPSVQEGAARHGERPELQRMPPVVPGAAELDGELRTIVCPADGAPIGSYVDTGRAGVARAVACAKAAFEDGAWSGAERAERARALTRLADALDRRIDDLALLDALQTGRPLREMSAQVGRVSEWFRYFAALALSWETSVLPFPGAYHAYVEELPLGPVGLITPWNHPLLIMCKKLAAALAAGNTCVIKPSELTPLSTLAFGELTREAGIPEGVVNVVAGGGEVGQALVEHPDLARVDFTGGTATGRIVAAQAGTALTPATLELGGKAPVLVFDDVDIDEAVSGALFAGFIASGQTCVAGSRVLVHETIAEELGRRLAARADEIKLGHPLDAGVQMGPLASARQLDELRRALEQAAAEGAKPLTSRDAREVEERFPQGHFHPPVVLGDVGRETRIAREEVFGPVVAVIPVSGEDDAVAVANSLDVGLGASVWTRDVARAHRVASALRAGVVWVNDHHRNSPSAPWGGFGDSGFGRENGLEAYRSYVGTKTVVVRTAPGGFDWYDGSEQRYG